MVLLRRKLFEKEEIQAVFVMNFASFFEVNLLFLTFQNTLQCSNKSHHSFYRDVKVEI